MPAEDRVRGLPCWTGAIEVVPLKGGVSNASFTVQDRAGKFVARVGEDYPFHHVFREAEVIASQAAFEVGLSPEVVYTEPGIMVVRFYRSAHLCGSRRAGKCGSMRRYCEALPRGNGKRISGRANIFWRSMCCVITPTQLPRRSIVMFPTFHAGWRRSSGWKAQVPLPIIFGHHDLLPTNFMDDGKRLWLIDWEYGGFGTAMFDLANIASNNQFTEQAEKDLLTRYFERKPDQALLRSFYAMKKPQRLARSRVGHGFGNPSQCAGRGLRGLCTRISRAL
jgi:thiamine kinase-like enzyme